MAKELIYKVRIEMDSSSATKSTSRLENTQENAEKAIDKTTAAIRRQSEASESNTRSQRNFAKATSNANQTLFSFGDLVNDSAQFQFGFAQGSRAIGNNIGFMAEQFSNVQARAGGFTGALKALGSSLLGPGGLILGINVVVTALTVFGDKLLGDSDSVSAKAEEARKELVELRKEIDRFDIRFQQLAELQKEAFDDLDNVQALRQQVQFAREIEATLANNLDTVRKTVEQRKTQVELLESFVGNQRAVNEAAADGLITRRFAEQILRDENVLMTRLNKRQNELEEAKIDQAALETSINSANEKQIQLLAKINELEAGRASSTFQALQNIIKAQQARGQDLLGGPFGFEAVELTAEDFMSLNIQDTNIGEFSKDLLGNIRSIKQSEVQIFKQAEDQKTQIARIAEAQRQEIFVNAIGAAGDLIGQAFGQSKELAVAQTIVSTYAAAQKAYESQLAIPTPDAPARAAAAAAVAVAQGLARLAAIRSTQLGSGGGGQGDSSRSTRQEGANIGSLGEFDNRTRVIEPNRGQNPVVINVTNRIDREGMALAVKDGNAVLNQRTTQISSD